ncbi:oxygen-independent coproporphyrinogen III oxidase [Niabella drilacis]|uniref:Coproporphyrinogen-III oxidase n=1 Tax=Niabella drilacis (strain DSM 25811 / CCM 8410 / CCUG 62505 / LMG 26954 / E90) TaxID=1285928 RepID=A0A1G6YQV6_NIADE|nr:oxygen-independent coproporphyrinogen III oxidase [Niabella drilacis]SDD92047.1 oxygen-independent coproporphyrinogen-3 oxidase [Niabella drilacis]
MQQNLVQKYNIQGPRYTSYPTVPYWEPEHFTTGAWTEALIRSFRETNTTQGISVYIHLPFCESLCTFCACHKRITRRHDVELPYIQTVLQEWELYCALLPDPPVIKELHLGGGTPTFFSPEHLALLLNGIFSKAVIAPAPEFSFEGHPNNTTPAHLQVLYELGFRRVSFGVQDYDPLVQKAIHRIQPFERVAAVTAGARSVGYESVSHDLVFGLPFQTWASMQSTIERTIELKPDRIAFYSYAHVPWVKGVGQRGFRDTDLPSPELKRKLYEEGKALLERSGYVEIGMDHFALPGDALHQSLHNGQLHRNFMGYSSSATQVMIGLGMSAISDSWYAFGQNEKSVEAYRERVQEGRLPVVKGHLLNEEDLKIRKHILNIMCRLKTSWQEPEMQLPGLPEITSRLQEMEQDGLLEIFDGGVNVTAAGRAFVRNIAMAFDLRLIRKQPGTQIFSMTV